MAIGPGYRAEQASDGTWTIFDVPVFAVHEHPTFGKFGAKWLKAALGMAQTRAAEGYLPPLHVRHHDEPTGAPVRGAGRFRLTRVGPVSHGGEQIQALWADLIGVRPEIYAEIARGDFPYRSVEIHAAHVDPKAAEIDSIALLDDEVPFFRLPMLRISDQQPLISTKLQATGPVLAYQATATGKARAVLVRFQEEPPMADEDTDDSGDDVSAMFKQIMLALQAIAGKAADDDDPDEEEKDEEKFADHEDEEKDDEKMDAAEAPSQTSAGPVEVGITLNRKAQAEFDAMAAQIKALKAGLGKVEGEKRISLKATALATSGLTPNQVADYCAYAAKNGEQAAKHYADAMSKFGPSDPPPSWGIASGSNAPQEDPAEVAKYGEKGPEQLHEARDLHRSWKNGHTTQTLPDYIEANIDPQGFIAKGRSK